MTMFLRVETKVSYKVEALSPSPLFEIALQSFYA